MNLLLKQMSTKVVGLFCSIWLHKSLRIFAACVEITKRKKIETITAFGTFRKRTRTCRGLRNAQREFDIYARNIGSWNFTMTTRQAHERNTNWTADDRLQTTWRVGKTPNTYSSSTHSSSNRRHSRGFFFYC